MLGLERDSVTMEVWGLRELWVGAGWALCRETRGLLPR